MLYAIELNERQSARTLEQAIRHQAVVVIEPRIWPALEVINCRLQSTGAVAPVGRRSYSAPLVAVVEPSAERPDSAVPVVPATQRSATTGALDRATIARYYALVGTYCDVELELGNNRYLFSADVVGVEAGGKLERGVEIHLTRPDVLQVAQRRRFRRIQLPQSSQVEIRWRTDDGSSSGGIGWLYNVGQDGLACRSDTLLADRLWIGQELTLEFSLRPGEPEHYCVDAVLCNKTPAGSADRTILGLQFMSGPGHEPSSAVLESLRRRLRALASSPAGSRKGVDA